MVMIMMVMMVVVVKQLVVMTMVVAMSPKVMETASDPPKCVRHGGKQVQENVEQGIVCFQVQVFCTFVHPYILLANLFTLSNEIAAPILASL